MEVRKIMTKNPACCTPDSTLQEVAHMMEMYDCGCIPVVGDHKTAQPVGTITDRDVAIRALGAGKNPSEMKASDIMTTDIATVTPETTVEQCRDEMEERQIRRILVVDKSGRCVGIVAQADLVQNESNPRETAEFVRDVSQPTRGAATTRNDFSTERENISSERETYRNFSDQNRQNRDYGRHSPSREEERTRSFSEQNRKTERPPKREKSFFGGSLLLPLAIGVGAGAALKYFMPAQEKSQTTFVPRERVASSVHTQREETPVVLVEVPSEIVENSFGTIGKTTTATDTTGTLTLEDDKNTITEIGRTARS